MENKDDKPSAASDTLVNPCLPGEAYDQISDAQLWELFKASDKRAFDIIYDRLFRPLCGYGDKICADKSLVEDVIQDLFISLWTRRGHLGSTDSIKFYLFRCLRRMLIRRIQQEEKRSSAYSSASRTNFQLELSAKAHSTAISEEEEERKRILSKALYKLTDRQREAVYLKFYNNLTFQEVAEVMEIEVRSVYNLIGRTIDILRADFKNKHSSTEVISLSFIFAMLAVSFEYA
ncbi:sigma-70 family RNA polymerase sigma factor [Catalinimonas sp. 4WD22]|uniref:RNA polymerase sigma factor n=1 Tax=Catalinimonas locisalis TaxID=3133978 RepID=UPI0031010683